MWTTRSRAWERELVAECEAFLSGRYAPCLASRGGSVPPWAWLNLLAHGEPDDIKALANGDPHWRGCSGASVWHDALSFLAQEMVAQAIRQNLLLAELQRLSLIPLELELAGSREPSTSPTTFVGRVRHAIARHPSSRSG